MITEKEIFDSQIKIKNISAEIVKGFDDYIIVTEKNGRIFYQYSNDKFASKTLKTIKKLLIEGKKDDAYIRKYIRKLKKK